MKKVKKPKTKKKVRTADEGDFDQLDIERAKAINEEEMDEDYNPN